MTERDLFLAALEIEYPAERSAFERTPASPGSRPSLVTRVWLRQAPASWRDDANGGCLSVGASSNKTLDLSHVPWNCADDIGLPVRDWQRNEKSRSNEPAW